MTHRIILFRGMNTGGIRAPVGEQRTMAEAMGLTNPRTLLASGNLVVESDRDPSDLEKAVEAETEKRFGRVIGTIVRTPEQWAGLMAANPFPDEAEAAPSKLLAMVMKGPVPSGAVDYMRGFAAGEEKVAASDGVLWFWHPDGIGRSVKAQKGDPRRIGIGTARNWNTVNKLAAMVGLGEKG